MKVLRNWAEGWEGRVPSDPSFGSANAYTSSQPSTDNMMYELISVRAFKLLYIEVSHT